jgi:hypothetical protein
MLTAWQAQYHAENRRTAGRAAATEAPGDAAVCTNHSVRVPAQECAAWQALMRQGPWNPGDGPSGCPTQDPCQCAHVVCSENGGATHLLAPNSSSWGGGGFYDAGSGLLSC